MFKEKNCDPKYCDLYGLDFYDEKGLKEHWDKINQLITNLKDKEKFAFEHPLKDLKKTRQLATILADLGAGKTIIKKAQDWHIQKRKV